MNKRSLEELVDTRYGSRYSSERKKAIASIAYELAEYSPLKSVKTFTGDYVRIADVALDGLINSDTMIWDSLHKNRMRNLAKELTA